MWYLTVLLHPGWSLDKIYKIVLLNLINSYKNLFYIYYYFIEILTYKSWAMPI